MASSAWSMEYEFGSDQDFPLTVAGAGLALTAVGCADLEEDLTAERGWFVSSITFGERGSKKITLNGRNGDWFQKALFSELADRIEKSMDAAEAWAERRFGGFDAAALRARAVAA